MSSSPARATRCGAFLAAALLLAAPMASAQDSGPRVEVEIQVQREVVETASDGRQISRREPVQIAVPGDVLVYTLRAENTGEAPAFNARLQDPVPRGTVLIPESVPSQSVRIQASLDNGSSWHAFPALVDRASADGTHERVPAPADAYTHLRWVLDGKLDPGEQREVSFKVRIQ